MRPVLTDQELAEFRADVCRVAEGLFARRGVEGVTMRHIATELGCSPTTAYRYFKNKDEILSAVRAAAFNRFCEVIENATSSSSDPRQSARNVGQAYLDFALANPDAYRLMFDISQAALTRSTELAEALARADRSMVTYVAPLIDLGVLRGETHAVGQMLWATTHGLVMLRLSGIVTDDAVMRELHEMTIAALARGTKPRAGGSQDTSAGSRVRPAPARTARRKGR